MLIPNSLVVVTYQLTMGVPQAELREFTASPLILMNFGSRLAKTNPFATIAQNCIAVLICVSGFSVRERRAKEMIYLQAVTVKTDLNSDHPRRLPFLWVVVRTPGGSFDGLHKPGYVAFRE